VCAPIGSPYPEAGRARATAARRLCTVAGFYRYAEEEGLVPVSPAVHVRRPRLDYEPHADGLDRATGVGRPPGDWTTAGWRPFRTFPGRPSSR
jgi:hypothetical protein